MADRAGIPRLSIEHFKADWRSPDAPGSRLASVCRSAVAGSPEATGPRAADGPQRPVTLVWSEVELSPEPAVNRDEIVARWSAPTNPRGEPMSADVTRAGRRDVSGSRAAGAGHASRRWSGTERAWRGGRPAELG